MKTGQAAPKALKILLAEDDPRDVTKLNAALEKDGVAASFFVVRNGQQVVEYLRGDNDFENRELFPFPDLVVLNLHMPEMSGLDVLKWLKEHPACSNVPTVMLSASADGGDVEEAYRLGVNSYMRKPGSVESLIKMLRAVAGYWQLTERPESATACR